MSNRKIIFLIEKQNFHFTEEIDRLIVVIYYNQTTLNLHLMIEHFDV
jgi:hypothetical protein